MIIYKNIGRDNIWMKGKENKNFYRTVVFFNHVCNCKSVGVFNIIKTFFSK